MCGNDTVYHCSYWNDTIFHQMGMFGNCGTNDSVWCMTYFNGNLYIGGSFTYAGGVAANHIARWDGTTWYAVGNGFNNDVHALCVYNNQLYAGGEFTYSGSTGINYLGFWNGTAWNQVGGGTNDDVEAMCTWDNALYIGGDFTTAGGITVNHICKWDGTNFSAVGSGFTSEMMMPCMVHSLCVYDSSLYAGGMFSHCGGSDMHNIAKWNGSTWSSIGDIGEGMDYNVVSAMCVYNDQLFIGGNFGSCDNNSSNNIGVWNGNDWSTIGTGMNGNIRSFSVYHNKLYIGGSFTNAAGTTVSNIASYSTSTGIEIITPQIISVYPNPASEYIEYSWIANSTSNTTLTIIDATGKKVVQNSIGKLDSGLYTEQLDVSKLTNGIYFLTIDNGKQKLVSKFSVMK